MSKNGWMTGATNQRRDGETKSFFFLIHCAEKKILPCQVNIISMFKSLFFSTEKISGLKHRHVVVHVLQIGLTIKMNKDIV
jgi:hypothetical protein